MAEDASLEVLIQIREELAGLRRTRAELQGAKKDASSLGDALRQGLGIGGGMSLVTGAAALLRSTLQQSVFEALRLSKEVATTSQALDMSTESFQVLKDLIEDTGGEVDALKTGIKEMANALKSASKQDGAGEAFRKLGINVDAFARMPVEKRLETIGHAIMSATNRTSAYGQASEIVGSRNLPKLINALRVLAKDGYANVADEAKKAGQVMDQDTILRLAEAQKRLQDWKDRMTVSAGEGLAVADILGDAMKKDFWGTAAGFMRSAFTGNMSALVRAVVPTITPPKPADAPPSPAPTMATQEDYLRVAIAAADAKATLIEGDALADEATKRRQIVGVLAEQARLYERLLELRYADVKSGDPAPGLTEAEMQRWRERKEIEEKLAEIRQKSAGLRYAPVRRADKAAHDLVQVENRNRDGYMTAGEGALTGVREFMVGLGSTGEQVANILNSTLGQTVSSLSSDIWEAMKGTQGWGEAFKNVGNIAGRMLVQMIIQMTLVKSLQAALGWMGIATGAASGGAGTGSAGAGVGVTAAGGGSFLTSGPTNFTVGDNPGGVELVNVIPLSGIGQSSINGQALRMAGGGSALVGGGRATMRESSPVNVSFNFSTGVAATVRAEIMAMVPELRTLAVDAVAEAHSRNQIRLA